MAGNHATGLPLGESESLFKKLQPREYFQNYTDQGSRADGRSSLEDFRPVSISVGSISTADGSAIVKQGNTVVACGVKLELAEPKAESPDSGYLVVNVDLPPLCHSQFRPGPPSILAQNATYFVHEMVQNSALVDLKSLCVESGKWVWCVYVDMVCLNFDGNILDVCLKALVAALRNLKLPKAELVRDPDGDCAKDKVVVDDDVKTCLALNPALPICCSVAVFDGNKLLVDPTLEEEELAETVVTVVLQENLLAEANQGGQFAICGFHKPGGAPVDLKVLLSCNDLAKKQAKHVKKLIDKALQPGPGET